MSFSYSHAHRQGSGTTEVVAVLFAMVNQTPMVLTVDSGKLLPNGPLMPLHRSLQAGVRQWVEEQTGQTLGYIEQLYTFVDTNRRNTDGHALVYVSYMGLLREADIVQLIDDSSSKKSMPFDKGQDSDNQQSNHQNGGVKWRSWYDYFPWENRQDDRSIEQTISIIEALKLWASSASNNHERQTREQRIALCWGQSSNQSNHEQPTWIAEHALLRYEMLYEAGLIPESPDYNPALNGLHVASKNAEVGLQNQQSQTLHRPITGEPMFYDHRRVIATAIARLRAKIEYRPLIFGLMPDEFTLLQLQQSVEALTGVGLHKQNFRRQLANQDLLEETGNFYTPKRGRPAKLFRFKFDIGLHSLLMDRKLPKR